MKIRQGMKVNHKHSVMILTILLATFFSILSCQKSGSTTPSDEAILFTAIAISPTYTPCSSTNVTSPMTIQLGTTYKYSITDGKICFFNITFSIAATNYITLSSYYGNQPIYAGQIGGGGITCNPTGSHLTDTSGCWTYMDEVSGQSYRSIPLTTGASYSYDIEVDGAAGIFALQVQ